MTFNIDRREMVTGFAALLGTWATAAMAADTNSAGLLAALERRSGGRLGVRALDLSTGRVLSHRAGERFRLQSSFKGLLTAMVLHRVASGRERLDAPIRFDERDLLAASPVTTAHVGSHRMTVGELCAATMATSDNAAANLLMRRIGGPAALTSYLRSIDDPITRVDHYEGPELSASDLPYDSTTPAAVTSTLGRILTGSVLPEVQRRQWEAWMESNVVGKSRLRAAFPNDWRSGDRTGTSDGICNDYAFARRPGRAPLLVCGAKKGFAVPGGRSTRSGTHRRRVADVVARLRTLIVDKEPIARNRLTGQTIHVDAGRYMT